MITQEEAERLVYEQINAPNPDWPDMPEMIVTCVEPHQLGWLVYYASRPWVETRDFKYAIAGNCPYLVSQGDGTMVDVYISGASFAESLQDAAIRLKSHLQS
jgi:hypothetical protein